MYKAGLFYEASLEYERCYFLSEDPGHKLEARLGRCYSHRQLGLFAEAARDLQELPMDRYNDSLQQLIRYETSLSQYLGGDFAAAQSSLDQYTYFAAKPSPGAMPALIQILVLNELHQYKQAEQAALKWIEQLQVIEKKRDSLSSLVREAYARPRLPRIASERRAVLFSRFIPGSGQAYAGYAGEGAVNFLLNLSALATGVYGVWQGYYISGYIVGAGMLQKLYFGGLKRAAYLVEKGNYHRSRRFNQESKELLLQIAKQKQ